MTEENKGLHRVYDRNYAIRTLQERRLMLTRNVPCPDCRQTIRIEPGQQVCLNPRCKCMLTEAAVDQAKGYSKSLSELAELNEMLPSSSRHKHRGDITRVKGGGFQVSDKRWMQGKKRVHPIDDSGPKAAAVRVTSPVHLALSKQWKPDTCRHSPHPGQPCVLTSKKLDMKKLRQAQGIYDKAKLANEGPGGIPFEGHTDQFRRDESYRTRCYQIGKCISWYVSVPATGIPDSHEPRVVVRFDDLDLEGRLEATRRWEAFKQGNAPNESRALYENWRFADRVPPPDHDLLEPSGYQAAGKARASERRYQIEVESIYGDSSGSSAAASSSTAWLATPPLAPAPALPGAHPKAGPPLILGPPPGRSPPKQAAK